MYEIPAGVGDDLFAVDSSRGIVTTRGNIDRESRSMYMIPIYVTEVTALNDFTNNFGYSKTNKNVIAATSATAAAVTTSSASLFDVATLVIKINDVNDHAPEFRLGTCYPLAVPENHEAAIIHTVVATDLDEGQNGDIVYTITGKKPSLFFDNKFKLNMYI